MFQHRPKLPAVLTNIGLLVVCGIAALCALIALFVCKYFFRKKKKDRLE